MNRLPRASGQAVVRALQRAGFTIQRQQSSHVILNHPDRTTLVVVPVHGSRDLPVGTMRGILRQAELTGDELAELL